MKNDELKHRHHSPEHRSQDYLLTTRIGGITRKIVWNDHATLLLDHPQGWTIAKVENDICIFDNSDTDLPRRSKSMILISTSEKNKTTLEIPPSMNGSRMRAMNFVIEPLAPIQPPYKQVIYDGSPNARIPRQLLMYQGVRHFLLKYRPVGAKMTARSGNNQVFTYERTPVGYSITAFTRDLQLKSQGKKKSLPIGVPYTMNEGEFFAASIIYGIHWWRFRSVITPDALPPLEEDETEDDAREASRLKAASQAIVTTLFLLLILSVGYNHFFPPPPKLIATKVELKAPKVIPHKEIAEVKPPPTPTPAPTPEKKKEIVKEKPTPQVEKKVVKKEPVKPKKIAKKEPPKKPIMEKPKPPPPEKVAKKEPEAAPPAQKAVDTPPKPGVVAKKNPAPPAPDESAQLMKSLSFLSSGAKAPKLGGLAKYDKSNKKDFMNSPTLGGSAKDSATLNKISSADTDTNIKTRSARNIASDAGFGSPKGKGLNDVQGKVSMNEIYNPSGGGGFEEGSAMALSGPGDLSEAEIEKALAKYLAKFQFCYEKSLLTDSSLAGNIRLQWTITTAGKVNDSKVINTQMKNAGLQSCILGVLKDIPFPHPKGGSVTAKKTFSFKSSSL
jgi:hypothetical protein